MTGADYALMAWRRRWLVLVLTIIGAAAGAFLTRDGDKSYTSTAKVIVSFQVGANPNDLLQGNNFAISRVQSYVDIVTSDAVLGPAAATTGDDVQTLRDEVSAAAESETAVMSITADTGGPEESARVANSVARSFARVAPRFEPTTASGKSPIRISFVQRAQSGSLDPSHRGIKVAAATVAGFGIGLLIAILRSVLTANLEPRWLRPQESTEPEPEREHDPTVVP
jgi:capsular polysaccharide biosynthesis protein